MNIIGITGFAGVGKDSLAEGFQLQGYRQYSFAGPLKAGCAALFDIPRPVFDDPEYKEQEDSYWKISPRKIAQFVGTEFFRDQINKLLPDLEQSFWISRLERELIIDYNSPEDVKVVISDVRFQDELDWITSKEGKIIHLTRPGRDGTVGISNHRSESYLDYSELLPGINYFSYLNDGSLADLYAVAATIST